MGRTVHLAGGDIETHELGQPIDGAFDRLYAAFENGIPSINDEFRNAAFQYFDQYIGSVHAPAAHDHYFICFTPLWNAFMAGGRLDAAEKVWELAFDPVNKWESAHPGELIDKGTLCYFWGATALLRGDLDRGYLLVHQSVEEDSRTSGLTIPPTPSYALVSLNYQKPDQWFRPWVIEQARFLETFVKDYAATHGRPFTIDDLKVKFLDKPPSLDAIFLLTFTLARLRGISGLPDQAKRNVPRGTPTGESGSNMEEPMLLAAAIDRANCRRVISILGYSSIYESYVGYLSRLDWHRALSAWCENYRHPKCGCSTRIDPDSGSN